MLRRLRDPHGRNHRARPHARVWTVCGMIRRSPNVILNLLLYWAIGALKPQPNILL
jgi:hypothetical protein